MIAKQNFVRMTQKVYWLYEQQGGSANFASCLDRYLKNWATWAKVWLKASPLSFKEIRINLNKNIDPDLKIINNQSRPTDKSFIRVLLHRI